MYFHKIYIRIFTSCTRLHHYLEPSTSNGPNVPPAKEEPEFRPIFEPRQDSNIAPAPQSQEIPPRFVPDDLNDFQVPTLQPVVPRQQGPQLPRVDWRTQPQVEPTQQPRREPEFVPPTVDLPQQPPSFGRHRGSNSVDSRKQEFIANAPLSQNAQTTASIAQARFESQSLPSAPIQQHRPSLPSLTEVDRNVQQLGKQFIEVNGNVPSRQFIEVNGNVQQPTRQPPFEVDRSVQQQQQLNQKIFSVESFRRDPQPAPTPKLESQFVPRRLPEIIGEVERDAFEIGRSVDSPPSFGPNKQVKQHEQIDNPYATRPIPSQPSTQNINDRYIPPTPALRPQGPIVTEDINTRYIPPTPALRPPEPSYPIPAPPQKTFDINSQYIPPAPATIAPINPNEPATTRAPLPKVLSQPHPNTYPPNLENQYPNQRVFQKEPLPAPSPRLETQFVSRPPVLSTLAPTTTTKKHPKEIIFKPIDEEPDSVEKGSSIDESPKAVPHGVSPKLPIRPIKTHDKPHSIALPSESNAALPPASHHEKPHSIALPSESSSSATTQASSTKVHDQPHAVALPSGPNEFPASQSSSSTSTKTPSTAQSTTHVQPHAIALPAEAKTNSVSQKLVELPNITTEKSKTTDSAITSKKQDEVEPKASAAKTRFVKHDEKAALAKVDKTLPVVEVSKSTEIVSSPATTQQQTTSSQSTTTTQKPTEPSTQTPTTKHVEQTYDASKRKAGSVTETPTNDEDLLMSVDSTKATQQNHETPSTGFQIALLICLQ